MLTISPLRVGREGAIDGGGGLDEFTDGLSSIGGAGDSLLDDIINFDDLFFGLDDSDVLPDLEVDPEMLAEFSNSSGGGSPPPMVTDAVSGAGEPPVSEAQKGLKEEEKSVGASSSSSEKKPSGSAPKSSQGKRKVKVDWTPELHRRFVQAVEQLGVDKAVPSRILEIMGIDCLTRHNIASHLQKYRSHRKHLLAREAEAVSWSQRRQIYGGATAAGKRNVTTPWLAPPPPPPPTIGLPPHPPQPMPPYRLLHVWGHPTVDPHQSPAAPMLHVWPKNVITPQHHPWAPPPGPPDPTYWHPHYRRGGRDGWVPGVMTRGTPCFPPSMGSPRFPAMTLPGVPPPPPLLRSLYKADNGAALSRRKAEFRVQCQAHPSEETVDAAIGDVLMKPWLPLPLGLKPPSLDGVLVELQRQGISKIPTTTTTST
ncbi:putative transcription factor GLK1 [Acorus calamus]|uniref:Transcription factor GLK1 n=1 Tax=Acorus calamus TaxID=4465 RepID=A0AAV9DKY3_ACOCL|nr:putative transcription factor GLK1 [Acorus calamus]